jgi:carbamoyl-phosphate synthase large subunit
VEINILFTSIGRRVELVRVFKEALGKLGLRGNIVGIDADPLAPALQACDRHYIVPTLTSSQYVPALRRILEKEKVSLVFPLIDPDIPVLAGDRAILEQTGARLCVLPEASVEIVSDKCRTSEYFHRLGLKTPKTWLPQQLASVDFVFPLFIKPRCGSAAKGAFRVENVRQLELFLDYVPNPIVQEYLPGPEITTDVTVTHEREILAVVCRRRLEVRWGEVVKAVTVRDQGLIDACARVARRLPAVGPITVQCIMKEGEPHFTEINARLGGGVPLGVAAGVDFPKYLIAKAAGIAIDVPPVGQYEEGVHMTRFDNSYFVRMPGHDEIPGAHL